MAAECVIKSSLRSECSTSWKCHHLIPSSSFDVTFTLQHLEVSKYPVWKVLEVEENLTSRDIEGTFLSCDARRRSANNEKRKEEKKKTFRH